MPTRPTSVTIPSSCLMDLGSLIRSFSLLLQSALIWSQGTTSPSVLPKLSSSSSIIPPFHLRIADHGGDHSSELNHSPLPTCHLNELSALAPAAEQLAATLLLPFQPIQTPHYQKTHLPHKPYLDPSKPSLMPNNTPVAAAYETSFAGTSKDSVYSKRRRLLLEEDPDEALHTWQAATQTLIIAFEAKEFVTGTRVHMRDELVLDPLPSGEVSSVLVTVLPNGAPRFEKERGVAARISFGVAKRCSVMQRIMREWESALKEGTVVASSWLSESEAEGESAEEEERKRRISGSEKGGSGWGWRIWAGGGSRSCVREEMAFGFLGIHRQTMKQMRGEFPRIYFF
ncbi:hypothetical protein F3Y22_tig00110332pilonHSYRG01436 [Hibiscus syriacus]|uniref:Uncharacterized protein n=1 Tax=Hibiscus syriacus TaxID=106335 RepID=A0A6A3B213_HIBSY|nr:hypothetical protein F3Y22_tig00110332pilonHSYRG01436 [Hibiscus syriacus]